MRSELSLNAHNEMRDGNPHGGHYQRGDAMWIRWQAGPINEHGENGVQVEDVLEAALHRLAFLNTAGGGKFGCRENSLALTKIEEALHWLDHRTARRQRQGTEGTHVGT